MRRRQPRPSLILRVCAELGAGKITERYIIDDPGYLCDGHTDHRSGAITINVAHQTIDTVIHECLHRLEPSWSENYVRNRTAFLRNRLSDVEVQVIHDEYQKRVTKRKRPKNVRDE